AETETDASAGIDAYYSVTPALRANVTVNTDFAQTEVDQRQVNLTQYSLFFPEKRGFFLEGASYFDFASYESQNFGGSSRNVAVVPFFTRRVGLDANGDPQKIDLGVKLTGQAGRTSASCRSGPRARTARRAKTSPRCVSGATSCASRTSARSTRAATRDPASRRSRS